MLYSFYQTAADMMLPMRVWASVAGQGFAMGGEASAERWRAAGALCKMMTRASLSHRRPSFELDEIKMGNRMVPVVEQEVLATPFGTLLRFAKEGAGPQPKVLVVAPLDSPRLTRLLGRFVESVRRYKAGDAPMAQAPTAEATPQVERVSGAR